MTLLKFIIPALEFVSLNQPPRSNTMSRLTFANMKQAASEVFGLELVRSGSKFKLMDGETALGEGWGDVWTLKGITELWREWLNHPEVLTILRKELVEEPLTA
jgi:hypothetical protein